MSSLRGQRRSPIASYRRCSPVPTCAPRSASVTARSSSCSRARDSAGPSSPALPSPTCRSPAANPTRAAAQRSHPSAAIRPLEVVVRGSKRGRTRTIPLHAEALEALRAWYASRPAAATDTLFVSLRTRRSAAPESLSAGAVGDVVAKHAATAGVRDDRRTAHALRHTFCTMLAERDVAMEVIRALGGHVDIRPTQIYVDVTDRRKADGIAALEQAPHPLAG